MMNALRSLVGNDIDDGLWTGESDDMIALHHADGRFARLSVSARGVTGYEPAQLEGQPLTSIIAPGDRGKVLGALAAACYRGHHDRVQFGIIRKDGSAAHAEMSLWIDGAGQIRSIIRALSHSRAGASHAMTGRAANDAETMLGEAHAAQNGYLADLSHEIRTPLNAVIGFAEMMKHETFGPLGHAKYEEYAGLIHKSGQHLLSLVSDILDLSKIEADRYRLNREAVDIAAIVSDCVEMSRLGAEEAGLTIAADLEATDGPVMADPKVIRQIVLNLLSNAVKFTGEGRIEIRLRSDAENIWISVVDTGIGMTREQLDMVGKRFTEAQRDGVRGAKGTGLGLALCHALAKLHGGSLRLASREGRGTRASVRVPLVLPAEENPSADKSDEANVSAEVPADVSGDVPADIASVFDALGAELASIAGPGGVTGDLSGSAACDSAGGNVTTVTASMLPPHHGAGRRGAA